MPRTRCSSASSSTLGLALRLGRSLGGLVVGLGLGGLLALVGLLLGLLGLGLLGLGLLLGLGRRSGALGLVQALLDGGVVEGDLVGLLLRGLEGALGAGQTLVLLPVTGDLEEAEHRLGRLRADTEPVERPLGVDLDERRLLLRVVLA